LGDSLVQVSISCRDHPDIGADDSYASKAPELALFEHA
jgi:hypothetical protein